MNERKKERLAALAVSLKELLASSTYKSVADSVGISLHVIHRMQAGAVSSLSHENTKQLCSFLGIQVDEFKSYLDEKVSIVTITRNLSNAVITESKESLKALEILKADILPKLNCPDSLEAMRVIQIHFWAMADDYVLVKRNLHGAYSSIVPTIAELLQNKDLDFIASQVNLDLGRLQAIAKGEEPRCEELTLLAASLGIPIKDLEAVREAQFGKSSRHSLSGERKDKCAT
ncbi:MAG: hypothetical protein WBB28_28225 [Crinalium sp.]